MFSEQIRKSCMNCFSSYKRVFRVCTIPQLLNTHHELSIAAYAVSSLISLPDCKRRSQYPSFFTPTFSQSPQYITCDSTFTLEFSCLLISSFFTANVWFAYTDGLTVIVFQKPNTPSYFFTMKYRFST